LLVVKPKRGREDVAIKHPTEVVLYGLKEYALQTTPFCIIVKQAILHAPVDSTMQSQ